MNIDLSAQIKRSIDDAVERARAAEAKGDSAGASRAYESAAKLALQLAEKAPSRALELARKKQALHYRELARRREAGEGGGAGGGERRETEGGREDSTGDPERDKLRAAVTDLIVSSPITWEQIGGLEETKKEIKLALAISLARKPEGVELAGWRNMLFHGPPGTGKTLLAAATSSALRTGPDRRSCFFNVKVSSILSKYFGESSRIISELYGTARDASPSVIFLDEFESLCAARGDGDSGAERRILSTLLAELDGLAEKGKSDVYVMTIAATNRPWEIDPAILSRFEKKVLIPLPDAVSRKRILEILLTKRGFQLKLEVSELVKLTEGYSGRELERLAKEVTGRMVAQANADLVGLFDSDLEKAREYRIKTRPLTLEDFKQSAAGIVPQTKREEMERYLRWARELE